MLDKQLGGALANAVDNVDVFRLLYVNFMYVLRMHYLMTNLTISLSDDTINRLRRAVKNRYGGRKGALSGLIEESIREKLEVFEAPPQSQVFRAMKDGRVVAQAENLDNLAAELEKARVDPRSVRILSSKKLAPMVRTGLRGRES